MDNNKVKNFLLNNSVPILILIMVAIMFPLSGLSGDYLIREMIQRISRNLFLIMSLLIPIVAGMGLNFGIVLGAMGGQLALILITNWHIMGLQGIFLAMILSIPFSILLGYIGGVILNRAKGKEMITSMILGYFINGAYQLVVLYSMGKIFPVKDKTLLLSSGRGIKNTVDLTEVAKSIDNAIPLKLFGYEIPVLTILFIIALCFFVIWFRKTKLGQDMRAVGQDMEVSKSAGIEVNKVRIYAIVISTVLAGIGQVIYLQNLGTINTYNSHEQIGMFSVAALLIGGASVARATIPNAIGGVILFHTMFVVAPRAGKELMGSAQIGEYFRVFISYGIIALVLIIYEWRRKKEKEREREKAIGF